MTVRDRSIFQVSGVKILVFFLLCFALLLFGIVKAAQSYQSWKLSVASTAGIITELRSTRREFGGWNVEFIDSPIPDHHTTQSAQKLIVVRSQDLFRQLCPSDELFPGDQCVSLSWFGNNRKAKMLPLLQKLLHDRGVQETLKNLDISGRLLSESDSRAILQMSEMQSLDVMFTGIDLALFSEATFANNIKVLEVGGRRPEVNNRKKPNIPLSVLREWSLLEELEIYSADCSGDKTDADLVKKPGWKSLHTLKIGDVRNTLAVLLQHFETVNLTSVSLSKMRVDETLVDFLCTQKKLQELSLRYIECDEEAVRRLVNIQGLRKLDLFSQPVSPSVISELLSSGSIRELRCHVVEEKKSDVMFDPSIQTVHFYSRTPPYTTEP